MNPIPHTPSEGAGGPSRNLSLGKALQILHSFSREQREWSLADLSRAHGLPKATALRLLRTMEDHGFVLRGPNNRYRLGFELMRLANVLMDGLDLRNLVTPALRRLLEKFGETTYFIVRNGWDVVCVERLDSLHPIRLVVDIGSASPLGIGSFGKAILAYLHEADVDAVAEAAAAGQLPAAIAGGEALRPALAVVRAQGYALTSGERLVGVTGLTSPIFNAKGEPVGALGLSVTNGRFDASRLSEYGAALCAETRSISQSMGYEQWPAGGPPLSRAPGPLLIKRRAEPQ